MEIPLEIKGLERWKVYFATELQLLKDALIRYEIWERTVYKARFTAAKSVYYFSFLKIGEDVNGTDKW